MNTYNSFSEVVTANQNTVATGQTVWNRPYLFTADDAVAIDLRVELYAQEGVTGEEEKDRLYTALAGDTTPPLYGEIPPGFTGFSEKGLIGDTLVYDGSTFKVCDRNDVNLAGHKRLPDNWTEALLIT